MQRIDPLDTDTSEETVAELFRNIRKKMGGVPNILKTMARSPAAIEAYLGFSASIEAGRFNAGQRELVAIAVAGENSCDYCASAHSALGKIAGLEQSDMQLIIAGGDLPGQEGALISLTRKIVNQRGVLSDSDIEQFCSAGFDHGHLVELVALISLNLFTNYFNHIAATEIDFPVVLTRSAA